MSALDDVLEHYGTKGMKWGVRKNRSGGRNVDLKRVSSPPVSEDFLTARQLQSRHPATLSNKELKTLNERLNLEQNWAKMNPTTLERGRKAVKSIINDADTARKAWNLYVMTPQGKRTQERGAAWIAKQTAKKGGK